MLGDAGGQPVTELSVAVEPLKLVVRAGHLKRGSSDLRDARQRRRSAWVEQPRAAPHERYQEELGLRVQVERQYRAVAVRLSVTARSRSRGRCRGHGCRRPPVPARDGDCNLQPVIEHRARADHRGPCVHKPPSRRITVPLHAWQTYPVPVACHVQSVRLADVGDPCPLRGRRDHPGPPGQSPPSGNRQVHFWAPTEYQLATVGKPEDLARRGTHMRGHRPSLGTGPYGGHPRIRGWRGSIRIRLAPDGETPNTIVGASP